MPRNEKLELIKQITDDFFKGNKKKAVKHLASSSGINKPHNKITVNDLKKYYEREKNIEVLLEGERERNERYLRENNVKSDDLNIEDPPEWIPNDIVGFDFVGRQIDPDNKFNLIDGNYVFMAQERFEEHPKKVLENDFIERLNSLIKRVIDNLQPDGKIQAQMTFLFGDYEFFITGTGTNFLEVKDFTFENCLGTIAKVIQSNIEVDLSTLQLQIRVAKNSHRGGGDGGSFITDEEIRYNSNGNVIRPRYKIVSFQMGDLPDNYCVPFCLVFYLTRKLEKLEQSDKITHYYDKRRKTLRNDVLKLCKQAGVDLSNRRCTFEDLHKFEKVICAPIYLVKRGQIIYRTSKYDSVRQTVLPVCLITTNELDHVDLLIKDIYFGDRHFCYLCEKPYRKIHRCSEKKYVKCQNCRKKIEEDKISENDFLKNGMCEICNLIMNDNHKCNPMRLKCSTCGQIFEIIKKS